MAITVVASVHGHLSGKDVVLGESELAAGIHIVPAIVVAHHVNRGETSLVVIALQQQSCAAIGDGKDNLLAHIGVATTRDVVVGAKHESIRSIDHH